MPGNLSRADALKSRGKDAVRLMMGGAVLLVVAGIIEGFISPARSIRKSNSASAPYRAPRCTLLIARGTRTILGKRVKGE